MNTKRIVMGTLVGGIVLYATGYLIFDLAFGNFYPANVGSATGVYRDTALMWADVLGCMSYAALITLGLGNRPDSSHIGAGAKIGAIVGFLLWFTVDFISYGNRNVWNLTLTVVDPLLELIRGGVGGGVIAVVLGKALSSGGQQA